MSRLVVLLFGYSKLLKLLFLCNITPIYHLQFSRSSTQPRRGILALFFKAKHTRRFKTGLLFALIAVFTWCFTSLAPQFISLSFSSHSVLFFSFHSLPCPSAFFHYSFIILTPLPFSFILFSFFLFPFLSLNILTIQQTILSYSLLDKS